MKEIESHCKDGTCVQRPEALFHDMLLDASNDEFLKTPLDASKTPWQHAEDQDLCTTRGAGASGLRTSRLHGHALRLPQQHIGSPNCFAFLQALGRVRVLSKGISGSLNNCNNCWHKTHSQDCGHAMAHACTKMALRASQEPVHRPKPQVPQAVSTVFGSWGQ